MSEGTAPTTAEVDPADGSGDPDRWVRSGPPLATIADGIGGPRVDDLVRRAAQRAPGRTALRAPSGELTYAELDEGVDRTAAALALLVEDADTVVAIPAVLDAVFALAYFGVARAGAVSAVVNPLLSQERLLHVLRVCAARVALVTPELYPRLAAISGRLPALRTIVLTERDDTLGPETAGVPTLAELSASAPPFVAAPAPDDAGERVSCLQFTSGTTGAAKAAALTHRNLTVNAAQTAWAHRLDETSVLFTYLPTFHLMHLTIGVHAVATNVLWPDPDIAGSVRAAARHRATHYYSLPMRLSRLAADPELPELTAPTLSAVLSGGSALPPSAAVVLEQQFGVPLAQGYGMAENSPSTHLTDLDRPKPGSCGHPVPGARCRIVDTGTGRPVPDGTRGEIQLRGPQLMRGYLGRDLSRDVDGEGWFSTGDVGYHDEDGELIVVDRIKDTFKCDNWLVSPTEIERVLLRHPQVADCVVVDHPEPFSGAVAWAEVVPVDADADVAEITEFVNAKLPYYEHLRHVEMVETIERSATGKVSRHDVRARLLARG